MAAKKPSPPDEVARLAGKALANPKATHHEKSLAASVLVQTKQGRGRRVDDTAHKDSASSKTVGKSTKPLAASALAQRIVKPPAKAGSLSKSSITAAVKSVSGSMLSGKKPKSSQTKK